MDYLEIIKKTWQMTIKRPYLWLLGLFAGTGSYFSLIYSFNFSDFNHFRKNFSNTAQNLAVKAVSADDWQKFAGWLTDFVNDNWQILIIVGIVLFLLVIFLLILSISCQAGLIKSIKLIDNGRKELKFFGSINKGFHYFWSIFIVKIIVSLAIDLVIIIFALPIIIEAFFPFFIFIWLPLFMLTILLTSIFARLFVEIGLRLIVLEEFGAVGAIKKTLRSLKIILRE